MNRTIKKILLSLAIFLAMESILALILFTACEKITCIPGRGCPLVGGYCLLVSALFILFSLVNILASFLLADFVVVKNPGTFSKLLSVLIIFILGAGFYLLLFNKFLRFWWFIKSI